MAGSIGAPIVTVLKILSNPITRVMIPSNKPDNIGADAAGR